MGTSRAEISRWFDEGVKKGATHMIVVCDTFSYEDYPSYIMPGQSARGYKPGDMQRVMEVYCLLMDRNTQVMKNRVFNWDMPEEPEAVPLPPEAEFYAIRSKDGKWLRRKGYSGGGKSWVDDIADARLYGKPGPAKGQVTYWSKHAAEYGVPELVKLTVTKVEVIPQEDRVEKAKKAKAHRKLKAEAAKHRRELKNAQTALDAAKERLAQLEANT